jgi:glucose-1-phosphate thymidylyltransferase
MYLATAMGTKVIIPVAGIGSRLRPHTHTQPKSLIPVAGQPILAHILKPLVAEGLRDFIFVIGYLGDKIEQYITQQFPELNTHFVIQTIGKGTGHAIWLAKEYINPEDSLIIVLGDTIFDCDLKQALQNPHSLIGTRKVTDPRAFGVAETTDDGRITRLVEKPSIPKSNLAIVGFYKINRAESLLLALQYNSGQRHKTQGEYHLTDALMRMIELGEPMYKTDVDHWFDCGKKDVLLETNSRLLKRLEGHELPSSL